MVVASQEVGSKRVPQIWPETLWLLKARRNKSHDF